MFVSPLFSPKVVSPVVVINNVDEPFMVSSGVTVWVIVSMAAPPCKSWTIIFPASVGVAV